MSPHRKSRPRLIALLVALCFLPGGFVIASISWLRQQPDDLVFLLTGIAAAVTISASLALAAIHEGHMDEWQRTNARFSSHWGDAFGTSLLALLLSVPAFRDFVVSVMANWADTPNPDGKLVILTFVAGFMATVLIRVAFMVPLSIGWALWKSRAARESA